MTDETIDVAFGIEPDGTVLAVMPGIAATVGRVDRVTCYAHIGQHSGADLSYCMEELEQADCDAYEALLKELRRIGYDVRVIPLSSIGDADYNATRREQLGL